jgi:hypothetical protein
MVGCQPWPGTPPSLEWHCEWNLVATWGVFRMQGTYPSRRESNVNRRICTVAALALFPASIASGGQHEVGNTDVVIRPGAGGTTTVVWRAPTGSIVGRSIAGRFRAPLAAPGDTSRGRAVRGPVLLERTDDPDGVSEFRLLGNEPGTARVIRLGGRWSFDAISPDARIVFLLQHDVGGDPTHYAVRAYDVTKGRLRTGKIVDKREYNEQMSGNPVWREYGPGRRWAYTLYDRPDGAPFIHALDTSSTTAVCIDLPASLAQTGSVRSLRLRAHTAGKRLLVVDSSGARVALVAVEPVFDGYDNFAVVEPKSR